MFLAASKLLILWWPGTESNRRRQPFQGCALPNAVVGTRGSYSSSCYLHGCACGFYGDATRECRCTPGLIQRYLGKISGPLLDRIDIHIEVPAVPYQELRSNGAGESSVQIRARVERARAVQQARGYYNSRMPSRLVRKLCALDDAGERTLEMAVRRMGLSARAHDRILKVARTIADIGESETVSAKHVAEAVQYRSLDRNYWS
jgi:magnesium chelatase family protein